jgi:hypothetical protein
MTPDAASKSISHPEFRGRIGFARTVITPPQGIYARLWGSATHDIAEGVHRPMLASCVVLKSDVTGDELVLVALDAIAVWQEEADKIRGAILKRFGLQPPQLMVHPSHTHSSPMLARRHADRPGGHLIAPYLDSLPATCCELVAAARADFFPGILGWAYGTCSLAYNRDAVDPPSGRGVCGLNIEQPADDTLLVGRISDATGRTRGVLVNYACHPVSLGGANRLLSPDYIGPMREVVERDTGATCVFLHGASGNLTPRRSYEATIDAAEQNGRELGFAALATLNGMLPPGRRLDYHGIEESGTALGIWRSGDKTEVSSLIEAETVQVPLRLKAFPPRETIVARMAVATERFELERLERMLAIRDRLGTKTEGAFPVTLWRAGDAFLVATTGEPYSRFQVALREQFPGAAVAVMNLTNGTTNYLPEASAYELDVYPVRVTEYAPGCLESVIEQTVTMIRRLQ